MLKIMLNSKALTVDGEQNLEQLLLAQGFVDTHFAVAVNQDFVPRPLHATTFLHEGDVIETVAPMQGG